MRFRYFVSRGEVAVYKLIDHRTKMLTKLGPGNCFGEISILFHKPRNATVQVSRL
jgi:CRP-like cAMP-binding protein